MRSRDLLLPVMLVITGCGSQPSMSSGGNPPPSYLFPSASTMQLVTQFGTGTYDATTKQGDTITGLAQDSDGNIYVAGYTAGNLAGSNGTVGILKGTLYKFDPNGNQVWARELTTGSGDTLGGVALTSSGVEIAGATMGAYPGMSNPSGTSEPFVAVYDSNGNLQWLKQYTSSYPVQVETMTLDSNGSLLLGGETGDSGGGQDLWLVRIDSLGALLWQQTYGTGAIDVMLSVSTDASGNVYAAGSTDGAFPGGPSNANGMPFVLKLDGTSGATVWLQQFKNDSVLSAMYASAVEATSNGYLYVLGEVGIYGTNAAIELVQMDPGTGSANWKFQFGAGGQNLPGGSVIVDASGNVYVAGMTRGALASGVTTGVQDVFLAKVSASGAAIWAQQMGTGKEEPALGSTGSAPVFLTAGANDVVLGGVTAGQFPGFSNPTQAVELFLAKFGE